MLEYLEISWINAGSAWKTQKGCVALQLCSSGVLNLQGIPGSTCWSTTGVFVFNAGSHHTKGFDTSQQHHWRERQVASSVENSKSCPNKYHIYNSTCPKLKLDFWGFQMFPAFLSCLKLSQVVSGLCLGTQRSEVRGHIQGPELLQLIGASPAQPQPQPYAGGKVTCVELCRVSSGCFRCFVCSICVTVWSISFNFIILVNLELKLLNPSQTILWLVGSLARWCVSLSLPRDWRVLTKGLFLASTLMSHVIHWSDSFWFILIQWICSSIFLHVVPCFLRCFGSCFHMLSNLTPEILWHGQMSRADSLNFSDPHVTGRISSCWIPVFIEAMRKISRPAKRSVCIHEFGRPYNFRRDPSPSVHS